MRQVEHACDRHGKSTVTVNRFSDGTWSDPECKTCVSDERERKEAENEHKRQIAVEEGRKSRISFLLSRAGIPPRFAEKGLMNYNRVEGDASALDACGWYAEKFRDNRRNGRCIILAGAVGMGKTHLACGVIREVITRYAMSALYITAGNALRAVKACYQKGAEESEAGVYRNLTEPDLLFIDEIGVQFGTDDEKRILFEIINHRYEALKPTGIISNLGQAGIKEYLGDRCMDRLRENGGELIMFEGKSYRSK